VESYFRNYPAAGCLRNSLRLASTGLANGSVRPLHTFLGMLTTHRFIRYFTQPPYTASGFPSRRSCALTRSQVLGIGHTHSGFGGVLVSLNLLKGPTPDRSRVSTEAECSSHLEVTSPTTG
jgi:hypothetical protein